MLDPKVQICLLDASNILFIYILALTYSQLLQGKFVAEAMCIIAANTNVPVSAKCRIGLDEHDSYCELCKVFKLSLPLRK